ncbi:MAG: hypothetical protein M3025_03640 [Actinomycetota bacterium]|nr:hypothetical protein [Actinomycetota bacterium]
MRTDPRTRRYLPPSALALTRPILRYSYGREAYVLRLVGKRGGPVLRRERRTRQLLYSGPDRRSGDRSRMPPSVYPR